MAENDSPAAIPAAVKLKGTEWGKMGTVIGGGVIAVVTWANGLSNGITSLGNKLDAQGERLGRIEGRLDKSDERILNLERSIPIRPATSRGE